MVDETFKCYWFLLDNYTRKWPLVELCLLHMCLLQLAVRKTLRLQHLLRSPSMLFVHRFQRYHYTEQCKVLQGLEELL